LPALGCYNINVDASVPEGVVSSTPRVDSSKVPKPKTLAEAQEDLNLAYTRIQSLERKVQKLEADKKDLKAKNSSLEKRLDRYED
jgi:peptidoglycan hydrolase CwlO-like protein